MMIALIWAAVLLWLKYTETGDSLFAVLSIISIIGASTSWLIHYFKFETLKTKVKILELNQPPKEMKRND